MRGCEGRRGREGTGSCSRAARPALVPTGHNPPACPTSPPRPLDPAGQAVYPPEQERILGQRARRTRRVQARMARRGGAFQLAYALSMAVSFALLAGEALAWMD